MTVHAIPETKDIVPVGATPVVRKTPLQEAAIILSSLCEQIDAGCHLDDALVQAFNDSKLALADAVDRRIAFDTWIKGQIKTAKEARDEYAQRAKQLEALHERFKANTQAIVESQPDLPYQGRLGNIALQKSPPALELAFDKHLTPDMIDALAIPEDLVKTEVTYTLDTATVKAKLLAGQEYPWAKITQGQHVRFRK